MGQIFGSAAACHFLADMAARHDAPGDKCLAFAARVAGVPTAAARGMTPWFLHAELSAARPCEAQT